MMSRSPPPPRPMGIRIGCLLLAVWGAGIPVLLWFAIKHPSGHIERWILFALVVLLLAAMGSMIHGAVRGGQAVLRAVNRTNCLHCGYELSGVAKPHATVCPECGETAPGYQHDRNYYQPQGQAQAKRQPQDPKV